MKESIAELYVCDTCGSVELELHKGSSCENCKENNREGKLTCADFIPASRLIELERLAEAQHKTLERAQPEVKGVLVVQDVERVLKAYEDWKSRISDRLA